MVGAEPNHRELLHSTSLTCYAWCCVLAPKLNYLVACKACYELLITEHGLQLFNKLIIKVFTHVGM